MIHTGDNLRIMREMPEQSIDLVYMDPPFMSGKTWTTDKGTFKDTWKWDDKAEWGLNEIRKLELHRTVSILNGIGTGDSRASYLVYMTLRLWEVREILKTTGSFWLHCDTSASHYLKIICDTIFPHFRNEIVWRRTPYAGSSKSKAKQFPRDHDVLLWYTMSDDYAWHQPTEPYTEKYLKMFRFEDERGKYMSSPLKTYSQETYDRLKADNRLLSSSGKFPRYKQYLHESSGTTQINDIWGDIFLGSSAKERVGYPTQKPVALLERIISCSSNEGDTVLDPFCGSGTTLVAAKKLNRNYIGIDMNPDAIAIARERLHESD